MALFKATLLFSLTTNAETPNAAESRIGGWSESWYTSAVDQAEVRRRLMGPNPGSPPLAQRRAALLPRGARIVGQRYQQIDPAGPSQQTSVNLPGSADLSADVPQMAMLISVPSIGRTNIKRLVLRGIPDARVVQGEYFPSDAYDIALRTFFFGLVGWQFRGRDLSQATLVIEGVSAAGEVTTEVNHPYVVGDYVRILRTQDQGGNLFGGRFRVIAPVTARTFVLNGWEGGITDGGKVRLDAIVYPNVDAAAIQIGRVVVRKVGRPSSGYVGRR